MHRAKIVIFQLFKIIFDAHTKARRPACQLGTLAMFAAATLPLNANAQIIYSPAPATAVPALGVWGLLLLALAIALVALRDRGLKSNGSGTAAAVLLTGAIISTGAGVGLVSKAIADGNGGASAVLGFIDSPSGGSVPISNGSLNIFENTSGARQGIDDVILPSGCSNPNSGLIDGVGQCIVGQTVPTGTGGMCYADCR